MAYTQIRGGRAKISYTIGMSGAPVSRWFIFTVIPALTPLVWFASKLHARHFAVSPAVLFGKGELLLACSAFAATGLGEIIASGKKWRLGKYIAGGCCVIVLMTAIDDYGDIAVTLRQGICYDVAYTAIKDVWMCLCSIACGAICIRLGTYK
jgi:hypothetical protein